MSMGGPSIWCCVSATPIRWKSYCQRVVDGRLPELINDATQLPAALELPVTRELPVGAHLSVPIRFSDGGVYGTFCCFSTRPDGSLNERDLNTLRLFAAFAGRLLETQAKASRAAPASAAGSRACWPSGAMGWSTSPLCIWWRTASSATRRWRASAPTRSARRTNGSMKRAVGLQKELEIALIEAALQGFDRLPADSYLSLNVSPETIWPGRSARCSPASHWTG